MGLTLIRKSDATRPKRNPKIALVLSGGRTDITDSVSMAEIARLERQAFMSLVKQPATLARVAHTLKTGKPLRN